LKNAADKAVDGFWPTFRRNLSLRSSRCDFFDPSGNYVVYLRRFR